HLHLGHVVREERNVMPDEGLQPLLRIAGNREGLPRPFQDLREAALLDERQQVFFASDVVVHPGEGHPARGGEVPHGGRMVALVRKDPGGAGEQMVETLVVWSHLIRTLVRNGKLSTGLWLGKVGCLVSGVRDAMLTSDLTPLNIVHDLTSITRSPMAQPHMVPPAHDTALIAAWRAGDEQAAAELVGRHARPLARFLASAGAPDADVDDLVQETFIRAFRSVDRFRGHCQFRTWLLTIGGNVLKDFGRRAARRKMMPLDDGVRDATGDPH